MAHQFLSFHNEDLQIGNLWAEVVRGNNFSAFTPSVALGIRLHRTIDSFTDNSDLVKRASHLFHAEHRKYSPIIVDVLFDYFLIKNWKNYSDEKYHDFVLQTYKIIKKNINLFPLKLQKMLEALLFYDWFNEYSSLNGIEKTLKELSKRTKFENNMGNALTEIYLYYDELEIIFLTFFPELISHCKNFLVENDSGIRISF